MNFYILPANLQKVQNKLNAMVKHFTVKPTVTFSQPKPVDCTKHIIKYGEYNGIYSNRYTINLIEVNIDYVVANDWVLVASIHHDNGIVSKVSDEYFKHMPREFGLNYTKCDYCGKTHKSRLESHVVYNPNTDKWMQVGTACVNKMLNDGKYLSSFIYKVNKIIKEYDGCYSENLGVWCGGKSINIFSQAFNINALIPVVFEYRKTQQNWVKVCYEQTPYGSEKVPGSTDHIAVMLRNISEYPVDEQYNKTIFDFVKNLEAKTDFVKEIKQAFEAEYINLYEVSKVFFAIKMYDDSIKVDTFTPAVQANGIEYGVKYNITGKIEYTQLVENCGDEDGYLPYWAPAQYTEYYIRDTKSGLLFMVKSDTIKKFYVNDEIGYSFIVNVGCVSNRKEIIYTKGRLSKTPKTTYQKIA
jgi:hypothetical protein